jgi:AraC family transcriptional regulator, melibiose operon regulatory protein
MARLDRFGLRVWSGAVERMSDPHQHTEIELNLIVRGGITYRFGAQQLNLEAGEWMLFWGALPHVLSDRQPGTQCVWVTLPLSDFLRFGLPEAFSKSVLHGDPVRGQDAADTALFQRWAEDWRKPQSDTARILELELEARLRRLARVPQSQPRDLKLLGDTSSDRAARLAQFITEHHLKPLTMPQIAQAAGLNPNYAAVLFKHRFGMTMLEYLTQHRVAHAQRLLATTDMGVLELAFESGFGSSSRFYVAFERATGRSPLEYRRGVRVR